MPVPTQHASIAAWQDETHVIENRRLYREKFEKVLPLLDTCLPVKRPDAAFYLWPDIDGDDEVFVRELYRHKNVLTLPGSYLARAAGGVNPGAGRIRMSLVAPLAECIEAAQRISDFITSR